MTDSKSPDLRDLDDAKLGAVIETMFLAAYADGDFSEEERADFQKTVTSLGEGRLSDEAAKTLVARVEKDAAGDRAARLTAIRAALPDADTRELALSLALRVMAADGIIRTSEREMIMDLAEGLQIDRDRAADMVKSASPA